MTSFIWKGDDEGGDEFTSLFGVTFTAGVPQECGHLLPFQIHKLRNHRYFVEVPEDAPAPVMPETDERTLLKQELEEKGIEFDKRWGVERLRAALNPDAPPTEEV